MKINAYQQIESIDSQIQYLEERKKLLLIVDFFDKLKQILIISQNDEILISISRQESSFKPVYSGFYVNHDNLDTNEDHEANKVFKKFNLIMPNKWHDVCTFCTLPENTFIKFNKSTLIKNFIEYNFEPKFYKEYFNLELLNNLYEKKSIKKQLKI